MSDAIVSTNPATGEHLGSVPVCDAGAVREAVARARRAQQEWAVLPLDERCRRVRRVAERVLARADEIVELLVAETGKPRQEALLHEVVVVADLVHHFARRAPRILRPERVSLHLLKHRRSRLTFPPRGVVGVIAPWNFPLSIPLGQAAMALIAGNGVVIKPSELTPLVGRLVGELHVDAGLPPDLLQIVTGDGETGRALVDSGIDQCIFTGSTATGRRVAAACGERLIPATLELGGKAPAIVCADADLERTTGALVWGAFANAGQACASVERVYAHVSIHDELVERLTAAIGRLRVGPPRERPVDIGPLKRPAQLDVVDGLVRAAVADGARVAAGGERRDPYYPPTLVVGAGQEMAIMRDEIFGPVMPVMAVSSDDEATELANDIDRGLLAYVFTGDADRGRTLASRISAGTVMVNDVLTAFGCPETPWGGVGASGIGRTHSAYGLRDLTAMRHVSSDRIALARDPWWYPYGDRVYRAALALARRLLHLPLR